MAGRLPVERTVEGLNPSKIKKIITQTSCVGVLTTDNELFIANASNGVINGYTMRFGLYDKAAFTKLTDEWFGFSPGEYIIDIAMNGNTFFVLTNQGNVYGWGASDRLGMNNTSTTDSARSAVKMDLSNVAQIACGNDWCVAVKKDGTVWGTGGNSYGILGRWIGTDRSMPNSRYRTAFEWVECPDLEI